MRYVLFIAAYLLAFTANAQQKEAKTKQTAIYEFDAARAIIHFDATADGKHWFAVDKFAQMQNIIINGRREELEFNEIPVATAQLSPDGNTLVWMGLERSYDAQGFNTTTTHLYEHTNAGLRLHGKFTADYNSLQFFPKFNKWVAILQAANNVNQKGEKDLIVENGKVISHGEPSPRMFSYDTTGTRWAYRASDKAKENLVSSTGKQFLYERRTANPYLPSDDPTVLLFTPDIKMFGTILDGRDYNLGFRDVAELFKTNYKATSSDTARFYIIFKNKKQPLFKWITNIAMDTAGRTIAYLASDPKEFGKSRRDDSRGVIVRDGNIIAGPYRKVGKLFISPSGKRIAYSASDGDEYQLYLDGKPVGKIGEYVDLSWSPDEKRIAYISMDDRGKMTVFANGKHSPIYERIGRIGWLVKGSGIEYLALRNTSLKKVVQYW
jgi:hypothetical protein